MYVEVTTEVTMATQVFSGKFNLLLAIPEFWVRASIKQIVRAVQETYTLFRQEPFKIHSIGTATFENNNSINLKPLEN